ncbi:MAG TPA: hypothetical protein PLL66_03690 [Bacteroidales bacterium]|nr:hypothetical protein [Bacteroidales bacterium]
MKSIVSLIVFIFVSTWLLNIPTADIKLNHDEKLSTEKAKVQVAILLDASNSMDGLINQAKSRLWNIINTLTTLKFNGQTPEIQIALYMYGNDGLPSSENYIRQITPFTSDLDMISEKLFSITTYGGSEYCGAVIQDAVRTLDWGSDDSDMRLIYIAGNEEFTQGNVSYKEAVSEALKKDIFINTIHCGDYYEGVSGFWKDAADRGQGKFFNINSDAKVRYIATPYDDKINYYNTKLNNTYIYYGDYGVTNYTNQSTQDNNALSISNENSVNRAVSKSQSIYDNYSWDLIDKIVQDSEYINKVDMKTLPEEYQKMSRDELQKEVDEMSKEREEIRNEINDLAEKRQEYIDEKMQEENIEDDFGLAIESSILEFAKIKGFEVK